MAATEALLKELDDVLAVVLYGSVARGEADRRSDTDTSMNGVTGRLNGEAEFTGDISDES